VPVINDTGITGRGRGVYIYIYIGRGDKIPVRDLKRNTEQS